MKSSRTAPAWLPVACSLSRAPLPLDEPWSLVTAPDEQERCCLVLRDERCQHATMYRVAGKGGALDDYTHVCKCHLEFVRRPDDVVTFVE